MEKLRYMRVSDEIECKCDDENERARKRKTVHSFSLDMSLAGGFGKNRQT